MPQTTQDKRGIWLPNTTGYKWSSFYPGGDRPATAWKIAKAQAFGQKMPMYGVYPRPTGEVSASAPHLWAHSTMPYVLKPGVQGGCWPFRWSITSGPSNFSVGSELARASIDGLVKHTVDSTYQKYTWSGSKSGSASMSLRCTDQLDNTLAFNYTVTVDDTKFVFVDVNAADDTGIGTISSPKKFFSSVWNATNANKIVVLRGGNHTLADPVSSNTVQLFTSRPIAIIGYPGETVNLNCSTHLFQDNGACNDLLIRDLNLTNIRTGDWNIWAFRFASQQNRITFDNISFSGLVSGTGADNNQGAITFFDSAAKSHNLFVVDCRLQSNCTISLLATFNYDDILIERPYADIVSQGGTNGDGFINVKDQSDRVTIRGAYAKGGFTAEPIKISNQNSPGVNQEVCWYTCVPNTVSASFWNQQRFSAGGGPYFDYAGQIKVPGDTSLTRMAMYSPANVPVLVEGLVGYGVGLFDLTGHSDGTVTNVLLSSSADIDSIGTLVNAGITHRLTRGSELWSTP